MYRTPEMVDLYSNCPITEKADVWALGCLLYKLCFMVHPFEDSGILRIVNANYSLPEEDKVFGAFHGTISECLHHSSWSWWGSSRVCTTCTMCVHVGMCVCACLHQCCVCVCRVVPVCRP